MAGIGKGKFRIKAVQPTMPTKALAASIWRREEKEKERKKEEEGVQRSDNPWAARWCLRL